MGSDGVVLDPPALGHGFGLPRESSKRVLNCSVTRNSSRNRPLNDSVAVLPGYARFDERGLDLAEATPVTHCWCSESTRMVVSLAVNDHAAAVARASRVNSSTTGKTGSTGRRR
jgi:hypothetical protein